MISALSSMRRAFAAALAPAATPPTIKIRRLTCDLPSFEFFDTTTVDGVKHPPRKKAATDFGGGPSGYA